MKEDVANNKEHLAKLKVLGDMFKRGEISEDQLHDEVDKLLGEYGFFNKLKTYIDKKVNYAIPLSKGVRERFDLRTYSQIRSQKTTKLIESENWKSTFDDEPFDKFDKPSSSDIEAVHSMNESDLLDFQQCIIRALKTLIDNHEENTPLAEKLHAYYLLLHGELASRPITKQIPDYANRDGFLEYIESREEREKEDALYDNARVEGNICINCGSSNVHSFNKEEWICKDCKKAGRHPYRFRKH